MVALLRKNAQKNKLIENPHQYISQIEIKARIIIPSLAQTSSEDLKLDDDCPTSIVNERRFFFFVWVYYDLQLCSVEYKKSWGFIKNGDGMGEKWVGTRKLVGEVGDLANPIATTTGFAILHLLCFRKWLVKTPILDFEIQIFTTLRIKELCIGIDA